MSKRPRTAANSLLISLFAFAVAAVFVGYLYWRTGNRTNLVSPERGEFYTESITPILDENKSANAKALQALKNEVHVQFEQYRKRVPAFTDDITSFSNKTKITWEATKQMTSDDKVKVQRHVTGKFEMHVVSAETMQKDLERILQAFRKDIEANKNRMLVDIDVAVKDDPRFSASGAKIPENFRDKIEVDIAAVSLQAGKDAVVLSGMTFLVALATEEAVRHLVTAVLTRVSASLAGSMATTAALSGGAAAAGGAGGGGVGSLGGPAGVVIGLAAGITVGAIVDYVMTDRMEEKLNKECTTFLTTAETELTTAPLGLIATMEKALAEIEKVEGDLIKKQINSLP